MIFLLLAATNEAFIDCQIPLMWADRRIECRLMNPIFFQLRREDSK